MKIGIASDHAGFEYKERIALMLGKLGYDVVDFGTDTNEDCDYPQFVRPCAEALANREVERAVVIGGSGNGEAMVANRVPGVRCALCWNEESARLARRHNDANALSLGQRMMSETQALNIVTVWLNEPFDGGRHAVRIAQIDSKVGV